MAKKKIALTLVLLLVSYCAFAQGNTNETLRITTYYPSPHGVYGILTLFPRDEMPEEARQGDLCFNRTSESLMIYKNEAEGWQNLTITSGEKLEPGDSIAGGWEHNITTGIVHNVNTGNIGIGTSTPTCKLQVGRTKAVSITDDGKLGIGIDNPKAVFQITGPKIDEVDFPLGEDDFDKYTLLLCECPSSKGSYGMGVMNFVGYWFNSPTSYRFYSGGNENVLTITTTGVGIRTASPAYALDVQHDTLKVNSKNGYLTNGADYAEYFPNEGVIPDRSLVGLNIKTGKVRSYRQGDEFVGVVSCRSGFVGNSNKEIENDSSYTLVGLMGQLDYNKEQVIIEGRKVYTKDKKYIGILLSNDKIFLR